MMDEYIMKIATKISETKEDIIVEILFDRYGETYKINKKQIERIFANHNKYRWHDLRKNEDDLPPTSTEVLLKFKETYELGEYVPSEYSRGWISENHDVDLRYDDIDEFPIAWKYIEPFNEGEENV